MRRENATVVSFIVLLSTCLLLSGCAALFTGTSQNVMVQSSPAGATIQVNGMQVGTTPGQVTLKRGSSQVLVVSKEGYEPQTVMLGTKFNGWVLLNLLWGYALLIPVLIDVFTGAWAWVDPEVVMVTLVPRR